MDQNRAPTMDSDRDQAMSDTTLLVATGFMSLVVPHDTKDTAGLFA